MPFRVVFDKKAEKDMKKLDKTQAERIYSWIMEKIDGCENPRTFGKPITGSAAGNWRYRVGEYRVVCEIQDDVCLVLVVKVGHRSRVYD